MTESSKSENTSAERQRPADREHVLHHEQTEEYAGGYIKAHHGRIHLWLGVVYAVLFVWALYYGYTYWGGLGPGLDY